MNEETETDLSLAVSDTPERTFAERTTVADNNDLIARSARDGNDYSTFVPKAEDSLWFEKFEQGFFGSVMSCLSITTAMSRTPGKDGTLVSNSNIIARSEANVAIL